MKKMILLLISCFAIPAQANATLLVPIKSNTETADIRFTHSLKNTQNKMSNTFMSTEPINLQLNIKVKNDHVGQPGNLYLVAHYQDKWYQKTAAGNWQQWDQQQTSLATLSTKTLQKKESISVLSNDTLPAGEYLVYGGYQSKQLDTIYYNATPATLLVFEQQNAALHRVKNHALLSHYFALGSTSRNSGLFFADAGLPTVLATETTAAVGDSSSVSQTNLQEKGVDEADRIKTDGTQLYVLENCASGATKQCLASYTIQAAPATNTLLQKLDLNNTTRNAGIYLAQIKHKKHLIYHDDSSQFGLFDIWHFPGYWQNNQTNIKIFDVSQADDMQLSTHISMDTSLLSSRLIDGVLYLITRKNAYYRPTPELTAATFIPATEQQNSPAENPQVPENQSIDDLLPTISFNDGADPIPVVQTTDCFIPSQSSAKISDNTFITITAIPLDDPKTHYSSCVAGAVDTFYMSQTALYLATSRYPYTVSGNAITFAPDSSERATQMHKFALTQGALDYRGSGTIPGHLGWDANKQPFRMGEYNGLLKVATSHGNQWDNSSSTRVSVLREATDSKKLEEISFLENLGKPGERLFAARFIQNRGYLVTFRQTDPLYVLDFSNPEKATMIGELEINGYSDYLHPLGDNYLLGIGKDAVPNKNPDFGALYQGVKLSLFDVSSAENLGEVDSIVLGKRGTEAAILTDHHALAWLPKTDDSALLAIPVQLNEQQSSRPNQDYSKPSAYYGWTHTGLYTFNINTGLNPGIALQGKLITDTAPEKCNEPGSFCSFSGQNTYADRAVIQQDSIHYIHNNTVFSAAIADLQ